MNAHTAPVRIGIGFDAHAFAAGRSLVLGGINIPYRLGLAGHSDADVLSHAVGDAMLGGLALGDLGRHFPDDNPVYKDISSLVLLQRIAAMVGSRGYRPVNIDAVIIAQEPKLAPYSSAMAKAIGGAVGLDAAEIGIKATTTEHMGFTGRGEGIAAMAVVLLARNLSDRD